MKTSPFGRVVFVAFFFHSAVAFAATDTWDGNNGVAPASNSLSYVFNWLDDTAPASDVGNTDLIFATAFKPNPDVSTPFSTHSLTFDNTSTAFTFGGSTLSVGTGGIVNNDSDTMTFNNAVDFSLVATSAISATSGGLTFAGTVTLPTTGLTVGGGFNTNFIEILGTGALTKSGNGVMSWKPSSTVGFNVTLNGGTMNIAADGTTDVLNSSTTVAVGATSILNMNESVTLDGGQLTRASGGQLNLAAGKTLTIQNGADASITGGFVNNTASTVAVTGAGSSLSTTTNFGTIGGATTNISAGGSISGGSGTVNVATSGNGAVTVSGTGSSFGGGVLTVATSGATGSVTFDTDSIGSFTDIKVDVAAAASTSGSLTLQTGADVTSNGLSIATTAGSNTGVVNVVGSGTSLTINGGAATNIGAASASAGTMNVLNSGVFESSSGTMTIFPTGTLAITNGVYHSHGNLTLDGGQLTHTGTGSLFSFDAGTTFTIQNGGDATITGDFDLLTAATANVTGAGSTLTTSVGIAVNGGGVLNVLAGGAAVSGSGGAMTIGSFTGGTALVDGTGSSLNSTGAVVGASTYTGNLTYSNSSTGSLGSIQLGTGSAGSTGNFNIQSGALVTGSALAIANTVGTSTGTATITGSGSGLTITGSGIITIGAATSSNGRLNVQSSGTFNSSTGTTTVNATGTIAIAGGNYTSHGNLTLNGGQLTRATGSVFGLDAGKTFTVQAGGDAIFTGNFTDSTASTITVTGAGSTLSDTQNLGIQGGATLNILAGGSVTSGASISVGTTTGDSSVLVDGAGSSLNSTTGSLGLSGLGFNGSVAFTNGSTGSIALSLSLSNSSTSGSDSALSVESGSSLTAAALDVGTGSVGSNIATMTVTGANSKLTLTGPNTSNVGNNFALGSSMLTIESGATLTTSTAAFNVNNTGEVDILAGGTLTGPADFGGNGPLVIAGNYFPGDASGANQTTSVTFAQNIVFQPSTSFNLEIGGTSAGTQYDQLVFNGAGNPQVTLKGALHVTQINGFVPQIGDSFQLFAYDPARVTGSFNLISFQGLPTGRYWRFDRLTVDGSTRVSVVGDTYNLWKPFGLGPFENDDDKDGIPNGIEFLLGTNPKAAYAAGQYPLTEMAPVFGANTTTSCIFKIPVDPAADAHYRVEASPDLASWTTVASKDGSGAWSGTAAVATGANVAGLVSITVTETLAANTTKRFHRLRALTP